MRYIRRLADRDLALDRTMIPLGSCTLKLNAAAQSAVWLSPGLAGIHPYAPATQTRGWRLLLDGLADRLAQLTGYDRCSLQPASGAQGELAGLLAVRGYLRATGQQQRDLVLVPASAHGTNATSAAGAGFSVKVVAAAEDGSIDVDHLRRLLAEHGERVAAIMLTYPSTHGVFEPQVTEVTALVHDAGGQDYIDGANLNALTGLLRPGDLGGDVSHLNLHKTFAIPHGGGGPGVGPVVVKKHLAPYLPAGPGGSAVTAEPWQRPYSRATASFTDFGGWQMPLRYTSDLAEHHAVRRSAGIFDLSHMGEVKVTGPEAGAALDHALVGALSAVAAGRARYTMMVSPSGGVIDDLIVYHVGDEEYLVVPNAGNRERVAAELVARCAGFDCTVEDISLATCLIAVQGPRAQEALVGVVESGAAMPGALRPLEGSEEDDCGPDVLCGPTLLERLRFYAAVRATAAGHSVLLARTGYTGEDGFELFCGAEDAVDLWTVITSAAAALEPTVIDGEPVPALTPCGLAARDSLRLEAGMPLYGHELHEGMTPCDAGLGAVVRLNKGAFVGRDALAARAEQEGTEGTSVLVALSAEGRRAARAGAPVLGEDGEVLGVVTSGLLSPTLGHPVALALLRPWREDAPAWPVGTELVADVRGRPLEVTVVTSPFYKRTR